MKKQLDQKLVVIIIVVVVAIAVGIWYMTANKQSNKTFEMNDAQQMEQYRNGLGGGVPGPPVPQGPQVPQGQ